MASPTTDPVVPDARTFTPPSAAMTGGAIATWGIVLVIGGAAFGDAEWAPAAFGAGIVTVAAALVAWLARRPGAAVSLALAGTSLGAVAAGWLGDDAATARLGIGGLMLLAAAAMIAQAAAGRAASASATPAANAAGAGLSPDIEQILRRIDEHAMLSDNARRVLFRERELSLLDQAIEDDIRDGRFDVALTLVDELADVFGERERAEAYRERILRDRRQRHEAVLHAALLELDGFLEHRQWRAAQEVADRIRRFQPDADVAVDIDRRFIAARARHKADLEAAFLAAVERGDTEDAMRILRELDHYLTTEEADRFRELAGGVIKQHRENLGVQFKMAVNDHRWTEAVSIGETIVAEFPNTKMAGEVRTMIELLRGRASGATSGDVAHGEGGAPIRPDATPAGSASSDLAPEGQA